MEKAAEREGNVEVSSSASEEESGGEEEEEVTEEEEVDGGGSVEVPFVVVSVELVGSLPSATSSQNSFTCFVRSLCSMSSNSSRLVNKIEVKVSMNPLRRRVNCVALSINTIQIA